MSGEARPGSPVQITADTLLSDAASWFQSDANATRYKDRSTAAGMIHRSVTPILGDDLAADIEQTFFVKSFGSSVKDATYRSDYDKVANSIASPIMRLSRILRIGEGDDLFTAMCVRAYLVQARQKVEQLRVTTPVTSIKMVDGERVTTVTNPQAEAEELEAKRVAAWERFEAFITGTVSTADGRERPRFPEGEARDAARLIGYAVGLADGTVNRGSDIGRAIEKKWDLFSIRSFAIKTNKPSRSRRIVNLIKLGLTP